MRAVRRRWWRPVLAFVLTASVTAVAGPGVVSLYLLALAAAVRAGGGQ